MAFKAEELMVQVAPGMRNLAQPDDKRPCKGHSKKPDCPEDSRPPCPGDTLNTCPEDTCFANQTVRGKTGTADLDLLRGQMKQRLSQELPS